MYLVFGMLLYLTLPYFTLPSKMYLCSSVYPSVLAFNLLYLTVLVRLSVQPLILFLDSSSKKKSTPRHVYNLSHSRTVFLWRWLRCRCRQSTAMCRTGMMLGS